MSTPPMLVRALVGAALCLALTASALFPVPENLPAVALGQIGFYRLEVALGAFYGLLLMVTPACSGLASGRLPIEISTRGAKFAEETDRLADRNRAAIKELESATGQLTEDLEIANLQIERLNASVDVTARNQR